MNDEIESVHYNQKLFDVARYDEHAPICVAGAEVVVAELVDERGSRLGWIYAYVIR